MSRVMCKYYLFDVEASANVNNDMGGVRECPTHVEGISERYEDRAILCCFLDYEFGLV